MSGERRNNENEVETGAHFFDRLSHFIDKNLQEVRVSWKD